jgi:hypothetical protein
MSDRGEELLRYLKEELAWERECDDSCYYPYTNRSGKALLKLYVSRVQQQLKELQQQLSEGLVEQANSPAAAAEPELQVSVRVLLRRVILR